MHRDEYPDELSVVLDLLEQRDAEKARAEGRAYVVILQNKEKVWRAFERNAPTDYVLRRMRELRQDQQRILG